ncbi:hypothetical protein EX30DRAFT_336511 [Ascodesmis nigricans]|uniref:RING-type domain-containing protein n=1 Tax=Ascodesmis nigricans TaxID=341454 RepID=A0A4S2MQA7_9PEZI|nr:hypothetical protein EX30DRAFT_336511 [Ascodesmis nigricans]
MSTTCDLCSAPLTDPDTGLPDSVLLPCSHTFHYPCIEDEYLNYDFPATASSSTTTTIPAPLPTASNSFPCPTCHTLHNPLLATLHNEGGLQHSYNLGAHLAEEAYYDARPHLKRMRAFLSFCAEGDAGDDGEVESDAGRLVDAVDRETGEGVLHVAAGNARWDVVRVLLEKGADLGRMDNAGRGVLDVVREVAGEEGVREVVEAAGWGR